MEHWYLHRLAAPILSDKSYCNSGTLLVCGLYLVTDLPDGTLVNDWSDGTPGFLLV
jgi:hypothetical protein